MLYDNEKPKCNYFQELTIQGCNICRANTPYSCDRSQREGLCTDGKPPVKTHRIIYVNGESRYLCNRACCTTPVKSVHRNKDVTCKNCLMGIKKLNKEYSEDPDAFEEKYRDMFIPPILMDLKQVEKSGTLVRRY